MMRAVVLAAVVILAGAWMAGPAPGDNCHGSGGESACGSKAATSASSPESDKQVCSVCAEPIGPQPVQLRGERAESFDCIFCALLGAEGRGDVSVIAASASSGEEIVLTRENGAWKASPSSAVALALPSPADRCGGRRLVFASADEFASYVEAHPALAKEKPNAIPLGQVGQIIEAGRPPLPKDAVCPVTKREFAPDRKTEWIMAKGEIYYLCCAGCKSRFGQ